MSFFYLTTVRGHIPAHLLEIIAFERLRYLKAVLRNDHSIYSEYLVEGSLYDNVGHFLVCITIIMCKKMELNQFLLKSERELFKRRLVALNAYELRCFAKKLLKSIKKQSVTPTFVDALQILCQHMMLKELAQHICSSTHNPDCETHSLSINFKYCLPFIAKRQIELKNGIATLPCGKWKQFLIMLFNTNLKYRLNSTNLDALDTDPRISELLMKLKGEIAPLLKLNDNGSVLLCRNVDNVSRDFPPCMLNLHQQLRLRHRLSHTQRFYYSLFLKDIGMPVDEAVEFWRGEYRQDPNGSHGCCHNWERDEKKYLYGIRHMYGLEGCRKNYTSVNCQRIQSLDSSSSEGGCPFKVFEPNKMINILKLNNHDPVWTQINELKLQNQHTSCCIKFLKSKFLKLGNTNCDIENYSFNFTPVKYYINASKLNVT